MEIKLRQIGNSSGVILPTEVLARMHVKAGDTLYLTETPNGIKISSLDPEVAQQIDLATQIMDEERDVLAALAKL
ncbi:MAG TPA: AbrB/MazE/SpoVT family DNA-binding domain-containing protein [Alphaproteobacteria bacterium]|nr:AbrB/MazE/SpoVT family DNA-binding domain-containing protein [Alphaproteobacteria bacterium]